MSQTVQLKAKAFSHASVLRQSMLLFVGDRSERHTLLGLRLDEAGYQDRVAASVEDAFSPIECAHRFGAGACDFQPKLVNRGGLMVGSSLAHNLTQEKRLLEEKDQTQAAVSRFRIPGHVPIMARLAGGADTGVPHRGRGGNVCRFAWFSSNVLCAD